jgi:hypothetical protein
MQDFIKKKCSKNPTIMKMFMRFHEQGDKICEYSINTIYTIIIKNKKYLSNCGISYNQIKNLKTLIKTLELLLNTTIDNLAPIQRKDLIKELNKDGISAEFNDLDVQVEINTYEFMKKYGSKEWCTVKSENMFKHYQGKDRVFFVVFKFNEKGILKDTQCITVTNKNVLYAAADKNDENLIDKEFYIKSKNIYVKQRVDTYDEFAKSKKQFFIMSIIWSVIFSVVFTLGKEWKEVPIFLVAAVLFSAIYSFINVAMATIFKAALNDLFHEFQDIKYINFYMNLLSTVFICGLLLIAFVLG